MMPDRLENRLLLISGRPLSQKSMKISKKINKTCLPFWSARPHNDDDVASGDQMRCLHLPAVVRSADLLLRRNLLVVY